MGMMPMMHPRMPNPAMPPGAFLSNLGTMGVVAEFMLHIIYGAVIHGRAGVADGRPLRT